MPVSVAMLAHLAQNVTFLVPLWSLTAVDGTVARYCAHTRNLTFNSLLYKAAPVEPTRFTQAIGLDADHGELFGVLDATVTEQDIQSGRWANATIVAEHVNYLDLSMGSVDVRSGIAGQFTINNGTFRVEFRSSSDRLRQEIGALTSPIDRHRSLVDLVGAGNMGPYTFGRSVTAVTDRRRFTINGAAQANDYFAYGKVTFTSGANNGLSMEIKNNVGNVIELQLPMRGDIAIGNNVTLIAGYDGSREQARDKFGAAENMQAESDLPYIRGLLKYPE